MRMRSKLLLPVAFLALLQIVSGAEDEPRDESEWGPARKSEQGVLIHAVRSRTQAGATEVRVLLPDAVATRSREQRFPVVYVLPVTPGTSDQYGNGLEEIRKLNLHQRHRAIFVAPTFSNWPWYADHPTNAQLQQETYFLKVVVPQVEREYPIEATAAGRHLLGFSKSGFGAFSLLLRYPDRFGKAAAWDAPFMMESPNKFGMEAIYGTQENFERYRIGTLLARRAADLGTTPRLFLTGHVNFRTHNEQLRDLLTKLKVPHEFTEGTAKQHVWHADWITDSVERLLRQP